MFTTKKKLPVLILAGLPAIALSSGLDEPTESIYVIDAKSVMPGYCQRNENGRTEGVFRSQTGGIVMWRNYAPDDNQNGLPVILKEQLEERVAGMEFKLSRDELDWGVYTLFGTLRIADDHEDVVMKLHPLAETKYVDENTRYVATAVRDENLKPKYEDIEGHSGMQFCIMLTAKKDYRPIKHAIDAFMYSSR